MTKEEWPRFILDELEMISETDLAKVNASFEELKEIDEEIGKMTDEQSQLAALVKKLVEKENEFLIEGRFSDEYDGRREIMTDAAEFERKKEIAKWLMFKLIRDHLHIRDDVTIAIRRGFKVVADCS